MAPQRSEDFLNEELFQTQVSLAPLTLLSQGSIELFYLEGRRLAGRHSLGPIMGEAAGPGGISCGLQSHS